MLGRILKLVIAARQRGHCRSHVMKIWPWKWGESSSSFRLCLLIIFLAAIVAGEKIGVSVFNCCLIWVPCPVDFLSGFVLRYVNGAFVSIYDYGYAMWRLNWNELKRNVFVDANETFCFNNWQRLTETILERTCEGKYDDGDKCGICYRDC
jgi:hypothetical protein